MLKYKKLLMNFNFLKKKNNIYTSGIVRKYNQKFGFLKVTTKINYFIPIQYITCIIHGDRITGIIHNQKNKKFIQPIKLIKSFLDIFIGQIYIIHNTIFIQPKYPFLKESLLCIYDNYKMDNFKNGDWFLAQLIKHQLRDNENFKVKLIRFLTSKQDTLAPWKVILANYYVEYQYYNIYYEKNILDKKIYRKDLTHLEFITIDNEDTKDIDDALFLQKKNNNIYLTIAISDPTAYISSGSTLDILASQKLLTNYLPGLKISMIPKELSENYFSLSPNVKKPVLICEVKIDDQGNISEKSKFFLAWIKSKEQLTYTNVANWMNKIGFWKPISKKIKNQINLLYELFSKRMKWKKKHSIIFQNSLEYKFNFSYKYEIINIFIIHRNIAHKMIEEAMIIANISAAKFLSKKLGFGIYNIHSGFHRKNIKNISEIFKKYNINFDLSDIDTLSGFCKIYRKLFQLSNNYINNFIMKYQSCALMSLIPKPHFSLGVQEYLTWTSPIRKYSDMINHRLLKNIILGNISKKPKENLLKKIMHYKKRNRIIKKNIENWLYIQYFIKKNFLNKVFKSKITNISPYGIEAILLSNGANIFIPIYLIHHNFKKIICDQKYGILFLNGYKLYQISDIILSKIIDIKIDTNKIIAKII